MTPVANNAACCVPDIFSTGLCISLAPAMTKDHLRTGAQKWTVLGPVSELSMRENLEAFPAADMIDN